MAVGAIGEQIHDPFFEFGRLFLFRTAPPCPVVEDHFRFRCGTVHTMLHGGVDVSDDLFLRDFAAAGTLFHIAAAAARGGIFGLGNGEDPPQIGNGGEDFFQSVFKVFKDLRRSGGAVGNGVAGENAPPSGFALVEGFRHTAGFVEIEIDLETVFFANFPDAFPS